MLTVDYAGTLHDWLYYNSCDPTNQSQAAQNFDAWYCIDFDNDDSMLYKINILILDKIDINCLASLHHFAHWAMYTNSNVMSCNCD